MEGYNVWSREGEGRYHADAEGGALGNATAAGICPCVMLAGERGAPGVQKSRALRWWWGESDPVDWQGGGEGGWGRGEGGGGGGEKGGGGGGGGGGAGRCWWGGGGGEGRATSC